MSGMRMWAGVALTALLAGPAVAAGGAHVRVQTATNVSAKVIVHTVSADGTQTTQVYGGGAARPTATDAPKAAVVTWLGVTTETSSEELRAQLSLDPGVGLTVFGVASGGPAEKAGIQEHDVLLRFNDQILMDPDQLRNLVRAKKAGDPAKLAYLRKGRLEAADVTLAEREEAEPDEARVIQLGDLSLDVENLMRQLPSLGGASVSFSTNWNFGGGGGASDPGEVMRNLKIDDAAIRRAVEEALKAASQAQQGLQK